MKKLAFGIALMISGALITTGAMIAGGLEIGGFNAGSGTWMTMADSDFANSFITIGIVALLAGLVISAIEAYRKEHS
jgi:hypothetical protein